MEFSACDVLTQVSPIKWEVENSVKTIKRLFSKCRESGQSEYLALLDWCNTPSEGIGTSPAQRFLGRRCRTLLPITGPLLCPRYSTVEDTEALKTQKIKQQVYYDRHVKTLKPIQPGQTVQMRLPGKDTWSTGTCTKVAGPRSYEIKVGNTTYRRNRRQLIHIDKHPPTEDLTMVPDQQERQISTRSTTETSDPSQQEDAQAKHQTDNLNSSPTQPITTPLRRSSRVTRAPSWMADYVPSDTIDIMDIN